MKVRESAVAQEDCCCNIPISLINPAEGEWKAQSCLDCSLEKVYVRVAERLGMDPSYVSKVASGKTVSLEIYRALLKELQRIERM